MQLPFAEVWVISKKEGVMFLSLLFRPKRRHWLQIKKAGSQQRTHSRRREAATHPEQLERRAMLTTFYVAPEEGFEITENFNDSGLDAGDVVTWYPSTGGAVGGLLFGTLAFDSIQAAIDAAVDGDRIEVRAGTYSPASTLMVDKEVAIVGAGSASTTIDVGGFNAWGVYIPADNVTLEGFTIQGDAAVNLQFALKVGTGNNTGSDAHINDGLVLADIVVQGTKRTGIDLNGVQNASLTDITSTGATSGFGFSISSSQNVTVTNLTTSDNAWGDVGIFPANPPYQFPEIAAPSGIVFAGDIALSSGDGVISVQDGALESGGTWVGTISNDPDADADVTVPASFDRVVNTTRDSDGLVMHNVGLTAAVNVLAVNLVGSGAFSDTAIQNLNSGNWEVFEGLSIQDAVTVAPAASVIEVAAGTYEESVTVSNAVSIRGPFADTVGDDELRSAADGTGEATIAGMFKVSSSGVVTVAGLRFLADGTTGVGGPSNPALQRLAASSGGAHQYLNNIFYSEVAAGTNAAGYRAISFEKLGAGSTLVSGNYITGSQTGKYDTSSWNRGLWSDGGGTSGITVSNNTFEYTRTAANLDVAGDATVSMTDNVVRTAGTGVSGGLNAASQLGNITGLVVSDVDTDFNFRNLSEPLTFDAGAAIGAATAADELIVTLGGSASDSLTGSANPDYIVGDAGDDVISGLAGNDTLIGGAGNDTLSGGAGTNVLDGDAGIDTATFAGNYADYTIAFDGANVVVTQTSGGSSADTITDVEKLQFADKTVIVVGSAVGSEYTTINQGITAASAGDVVLVAPGSYTMSLGEKIAINKSLTLRGAQAGVPATGSDRDGGESVIEGALGAGQSYEAIVVTASGVTIDGFKVTGFFRDGITVQQPATETAPGVSALQNVTIANNWVEKGDVGLSTSNGLLFGENTANDTNKTLAASLTNLTISGNYVKLGVSNGRSINFTSQFRGTGGSMTVNNLVMTSNTVYGTPSSGSNAVFMAQYGQQRFADATIASNTLYGSLSLSGVTNATVAGNTFKRVYLGLADSLINGNSFTSNGYYALALVGTADNNPTPSTNVELTGNTFDYNMAAAPGGATYDVGLMLASGTSASTITLAGNTFTNGTFSSSLPVAAIAQRSAGTTLNALNATANVFNGISLTDSTPTADLFAVLDQVADAVDASTLGTVTLKSGNVYVTPQSFWSPAPYSTTEADVQRAVDLAAAGNTVWVQTGAYAAGDATTTVDNLTVNVEAGVTGFTGLVLDGSVANGTLAGAGSVNLTGNDADNDLTGNDGDNVITGAGGTNTIDGNAGTDTAVFTENFADYTLAYDFEGDGSLTVTQTAGGSDVVTLSDVEILSFADAVVKVANGAGSEYALIQTGIGVADTDAYIFVGAGEHFEGFLLQKIELEGRPQVVAVENASIEYSTDNGINWSNAFTIAEGPNTFLVRKVLGGGEYSTPVQFQFEFDSVSPTVAMSTNKTSLTVGETATISFALNEPVSGFTSSDISVTGPGALSELTKVNNRLYTAIFTPNASADGAVTLSLPAGSFTDSSGNANEQAATVELSVDTILPTVAVTSDASTLDAGQSTTVRFTLSEAAADFTAEDVFVSGGTLTGFRGTGKQYQATVTADQDFDGNLSVTVLGGRFSDLAGNKNDGDTALAPAIDVRWAPELTITANRELLVGNQKAGIVFEFNKPVTDFDASYVTVVGGTLENFRGSDSRYTAVFEPTTDFEGEATISVAAGAASDDEGETNEAASLATPIMVDVKAPELTIDTDIDRDKYVLKSGETATLKFTFSEAVVGFEERDVIVRGGTITNFTKVSETLYTATFVPRDNWSGDTRIVVGARRFEDLYGNKSTERELAPPIRIETRVPGVQVRARPASIGLGQSTNLTFIVTGGDASGDLTADKIQVSDGEISDFRTRSASGQRTIFTAVYTAPATSTGTETITVPTGAFTIGTNPNGNTEGRLEIAVDASRPTIVITADSQNLGDGDVAEITFTLSEAAQRRTFRTQDVQVVGGRLQRFRAAGRSGDVYTARFVPFADFEGIATIFVAANRFTDRSGLGNEESNDLQIAVDTAAPLAPASVVLENDTGAEPDDGYTNDADLVVDGTLIEVGDDLSGEFEFQINSGSWTSVYSPVAGTHNNVDVRRLDAAGNASVARAIAFTYLTLGPAIDSVLPPPRSNGLPAGVYIDFDVQFDQAVGVVGTGLPYIELRGFTDDNPRRAELVDELPGGRVRLRYVVEAGDQAPTGIQVVPQLQLPGDVAIVDRAGNPAEAADLTFGFPNGLPRVVVNA